MKGLSQQKKASERPQSYKNLCNSNVKNCEEMGMISIFDILRANKDRILLKNLNRTLYYEVYRARRYSTLVY